MTSVALVLPERRPWGGALGVALAGHLAALAAGALLIHQRSPQPETPVMLIELQPLPRGNLVAAQLQSNPTPQLPQPAPPAGNPIDVPRVAVPDAADALTVPPKAMIPAVAAAVQSTPVALQARAAAPALAPPMSTAPVANPSIGDDPKARKAKANYYQVLMAYLARRKEYPAEARQARQQGIVTVRFTIDRQGNVSAVAIKRSSGFDALDVATVGLLRRVSPVPAIPAAMPRDTITVSLPIEYSLSTR